MTKQGEEQWILSTLLAPINARRLFYYFDERNFKATFSVSVVAKRKLEVLSNMDVASVVEFTSYESYRKSKERMRKVTFQKTPLMSTYLLCVVIEKMNYIASSLDDFRSPIHIWAAPDQGTETARGSLDIAVTAARLYEEKSDLRASYRSLI